ncbi:PREDICTED: uncharacterized protein LOC104727187 [Camelina sativa]|uniref:Uncharacterized protein LOC104727187 n=1 Tax=Camelina sativa TaxID=90675 RepID=A0ABM0UQE6_CAMSA|nr:PREDICTED: uncharacterized protein LOC104727187 [Camelina sativa]
MAVSFPRLPRWLCGGNNTKDREKKDSITKGSSSSSSSSLSPSLKKTINKSGSSSSSVKKTKRGGWIGRGGLGSGSGGEEDKMGNVVFPEPDDPEWSIGWVEPHGPGFKTEDDDCGGFVVLVPLYKKVIDGSGNHISNGFFSPTPDGKNMEQWLSSMGKL